MENLLMAFVILLGLFISVVLTKTLINVREVKQRLTKIAKVREVNELSKGAI